VREVLNSQKRRFLARAVAPEAGTVTPADQREVLQALAALVGGGMGVGRTELASQLEELLPLIFKTVLGHKAKAAPEAGLDKGLSSLSLTILFLYGESLHVQVQQISVMNDSAPSHIHAGQGGRGDAAQGYDQGPEPGRRPRDAAHPVRAARGG
jgi:hypothetical protein